MHQVRQSLSAASPTARLVMAAVVVYDIHVLRQYRGSRAAAPIMLAALSSAMWPCICNALKAWYQAAQARRGEEARRLRRMVMGNYSRAISG